MAQRLKLQVESDAESILVTFPQGPPPAAVFKRGDGGLVFKARQDATNTQVSAKAGDLSFVSASDQRDSVSQYVVGIVDRASGTLKLCEASAVIPLRHSHGQEAATIAQEDLSRYDRRKLLFNTFGSRKKQAEQRSREANMVDADKVVAVGVVGKLLNRAATDALSAADADGKGLDAAAMAQSETRLALLPSYNVEGTSVEEAYPITGVMDPAEASALTPAVKEVMGHLKKGGAVGKWQQTYPKYVLSHFAKLDGVDSQLKKTGRTDVRLLLYMSYLVRLYRAPYVLKTYTSPEGFGEVVPALSDIPSEIATKFLDTFCEKQTSDGHTKYARTQWLRDKLVLWMCVLCMHINNGDMMLDDLAADLKLSQLKLCQHFRDIGCTFQAVSVKRKADDVESEAAGAATPSTPGGERSYRVRLPLPLNFPKPKIGAGKRQG